MRLFIKNMVCDRCKTAVGSTLENLGLTPISITLGEVEITENLSDETKVTLDESLQAKGFELIDDPKSRLSEKIKNLIVDLVHNRNNEINVNLSEFLSDKTNHDYSFLSNAFSKQTGTTIEQFYIMQKIERVKELLEYGELNLNEIAFALNYGSASHLTRQFKKITSQTPTEFKASNLKRQPLDSL
ncbi:MAG: AraC family transcriptional regulator [Flavobacterium sp.]|uniref:helix-turn-helix domain-containing protein n=1 Tax=Flavobacterium sp. TaxID=239 RepID=UPI0012000C0F|nr:AraC family transcriptional regulator [Flavobacterium sp.]RZJ65618.1 MAG: AraC family transcriptional regulator [Flavobacterium sp.]